MADESATDFTTLTHSQAVNRLKDIFDELERINGKSALTEDDERSFSELTAEFAALDEHRKKLEREVEMAAVKKTLRDDLRSGVQAGRYRLDGPASSSSDYDRDAILEPDSLEAKRFRNPWDLSEVRTLSMSPSAVANELKSRALAAVERMQSCSDNVREAATNILEKWDDDTAKLSRQALLTSSPEYLSGWSKMSRNQQGALTPEEQRAMSLTTTAGGFLVPFQLDPTVIITADGSRNDIRQVARQVVATGNVWHGVSSPAPSFSGAGEAVEVSDDTTTFAQPTITLYKAAGFIPISLEALEDEQNVAQEVARLLAFGKDTIEATAFATGTGSQPQGIVTALVASSPTVIVTAAADDTFAIGDVYKVHDALPSRYQSGASWLAHPAIYSKVRQFDVYGGGSFWTNLNSNLPPQLLGHSVYQAEGMDGTITTSGAVHNYAMVVGDFSNYVIADRIGMTIEFIPHLFDTANNLPKGQRGWYAYYRVGADSVNDGAFRMLDVVSAA
jgi:HK97 family phage major capsid protein